MLERIKRPGRQPTRYEQLELIRHIPKRAPDERITVHHITEHGVNTLQLEIVRNSPTLGLAFERIFL